MDFSLRNPKRRRQSEADASDHLRNLLNANIGYYVVNTINLYVKFTQRAEHKQEIEFGYKQSLFITFIQINITQPKGCILR